MSDCMVKICGVKRPEDVDTIAQYGADYVGFIVNVKSPRAVSLDGARELAERAKTPVVLLFLDAEASFVEEAARLINPAAVQLAGEESPEYVRGLDVGNGCEIWKSVHLKAGEGQGEGAEAMLALIEKYKEAGAHRALLDTVVMAGGKKQMGGTGQTYDWDLAADIVQRSTLPVMMAGGLTPDNVAEAIAKVGPYGVDLSSGVEKEKGVKDPEKIKLFIAKVRR